MDLATVKANSDHIVIRELQHKNLPASAANVLQEMKDLRRSLRSAPVNKDTPHYLTYLDAEISRRTRPRV